MANWIERGYWDAFTLWHVRHERDLPFWRMQDLEKLQSQRVRTIIAHAYATVPYYREVMDQQGLAPRDFNTAEDLARLPLLTGDQLARTPERFLSCDYARGNSLPLHSTGTTGHFKTVHYDPAALFLSLANGHRQRRVLARFVGRTVGYREMTIARSNSVNFQIRDFYETHSWMPRGVDLTRDNIVPMGNFEQDIRQINTFKPDVILGYGSYTGVIFRWASRHRAPLWCPRAILYSADQMAVADRHLIEKEFGVPVFSAYQAIEALRIAFQCERRAGFHISLDQVAVRVVDEQGKPVAPGNAGEIVISNLTNQATVLLNYKLGDVVTLDRAPCLCGRTLPTIARIDGRIGELIAQPDGRMIYLSVITERFSDISGIIQTQLIQEEPRRFLLKIVCTEQANSEQTYQRLDAVLRSVLGNDIVTTIQHVEIIPPEPGGKVRAFISRCAI
ncbi:MAG: hypothetical protein L0Y55_19870 [Anaerolineales bacterium]|nr:hypothetical protein [Anaerolineales bacterium]